MLSNDTFPRHSTYLWSFEEALQRAPKKYIKAYYHNLTDYLPLHMHDFFEINIIANGAGKHLIGQREIYTRKGDIFIIPPYVDHGYACSGQLSVYHILLSHSFMATFSPFLEKMPGYKMLFNIEPILRSRTEKAYYLKSGDISYDKIRRFITLIEETGKETTSILENSIHVLSFISILSETHSALSLLRTEQLRDDHILPLVESMEYIENHHEEKINFREIAEKNAFSYATYLRLFKKISGVTPAEYQMSCRVEHAANMLLNTNETILSIALSCGFYDSSHFIRVFTKKKHLSPADYRNKMR